MHVRLIDQREEFSYTFPAGGLCGATAAACVQILSEPIAWQYLVPVGCSARLEATGRPCDKACPSEHTPFRTGAGAGQHHECLPSSATGHDGAGLRAVRGRRRGGGPQAGVPRVQRERRLPCHALIIIRCVLLDLYG